MIGAINGGFGLALCKETHPELVILDTDLRDCDGFTLVPKLRRLCPNVKILAFSQSCDRFTAYRAQSAALDGYLYKRRSAPADLVSAMRRVLAGHRYFDPFISTVQASLRDDPFAFNKLLSDRELELLGEIGTGRSNAEVAKIFRVSPSTVNNHRSAIMDKLSIHRTADLMRFAAENGITRLCQRQEFNELRTIKDPGEAWNCFRAPGETKAD